MALKNFGPETITNKTLQELGLTIEEFVAGYPARLAAYGINVTNIFGTECKGGYKLYGTREP